MNDSNFYKIEDNKIFSIWDEIVGSKISKVTEIKKLKNNIVYIK